MKKASVIVCANNEEKNIGLLWGKLPGLLSEFELIFVNDGSTDNTLLEMQRIKDRRVKVINVPIKQGKNLLLPKLAFHNLNEVVVTIDADLEDDIQSLPSMIEALSEADVVVGHRFKRQDTAARLLLSKIYNYLQGLLFGFHLPDSNCGLKAFRREAFQSVCRVLNRRSQYRFVSLLCFLNGYTVKSYPIKHFKRRFGKSHYGLGRVFSGVFDLLSICFFRKRFVFRKAAKKNP